jgi:anti-sigma B factor antagonist
MQSGAPGPRPVGPDAPGSARRDHSGPAPRVARGAEASGARTYRVGEYTVVELYGEIDLVGAASVGPRLDAATAQQVPAVIVDLRQVGFFDCSGMSLLYRAYRRAEERGGRLQVVCDSPLVLRTLRAGELLDLLRPVPALDDALQGG